MAVAARARRKADRGSRRLVVVGLAGLALAGVVMAAVFAWPLEEASGGRFELGPVDDYRVGSVTTIEEGAFHLVRLDERAFVALSWVDPHLGCTVPWRPDFVWPIDGGTRGWFRNPCHGETYDKAGRRVFGPSPRDLDRYPVSIVNGEVVVDTSRYVCGFAPPGERCVEATTAQ